MLNDTIEVQWKRAKETQSKTTREERQMKQGNKEKKRKREIKKETRCFVLIVLFDEKKRGNHIDKDYGLPLYNLLTSIDLTQHQHLP